MKPAPETKTVTVNAEMIQALRHTFTVPADTTDSEIEEMVNDLDGGEFEEIANGGDWSQEWSVK